MSAVTPPTPLDRLLAAIRLIIRGEIPAFTFFGTYEYSIQNVSGQTVDVRPTDTTLSLPSISNIPIFPSILAEAITGIPVGSICLVRFVNADPSRPEVCSISSLSQTATIDATDTVTLGSSNTTAVVIGGGSAPVARQGEQVATVVPLPTPPPMISGIINGALPFTGTMVGLPPGVTGIITGGFPGVQT